MRHLSSHSNRYSLLMWALLPVVVNAQDYDLLFTGEVFSQQAQEIFAFWLCLVSQIVVASLGFP